ncbi:MAG: Na+/H+ antiporter subunit E [Paracoccaceae bacterium]
MRTVGTVVVLFGLWLLMSGIYNPLLLGLGLASSIVAVYVGKRMDAQDDSTLELHLSPAQLLRYLGWLFVEIARANWAVSKVILSRKMPIRQHLFTVPSSQSTDVGQVVFANSITLTPGTITVETEEDHFIVHALAYSNDDPAALADMDARVSKSETQNPNVRGAA